MHSIDRLDMKVETLICDHHFMFEITRQCNMSCSYCYKDNNTKIPDNNKIEFYMFIRKITKLLEAHPNKTFEVDLLGGEPSISQYAVEYFNKLITLSTIHNNLKWITMTTNGQEFLYNHENLLKTNKFKIEITYHNSLKNIDKFIENLIKYKTSYNNVILTLNLFPKGFNLDKILRVLYVCKEYDIIVTVMSIFSDTTITYLDENIYKPIFDFINANNMINDKVTDQYAYKTKDYIRRIPTRCKLKTFTILFDGTIVSSCGYKLKDKLNIKYNEYPFDEEILCNASICQGASGYNQYLLSQKDFKEDEKNEKNNA